VIAELGQTTLDIYPKYVEQVTLIHEIGHAIGLVNNGLPMVEAHQDADHGAHCNNPDCVMYWANEGPNDMLKFAQNASMNQATIIFDSKCLNDARSY
jgi:hypothetical protein